MADLRYFNALFEEHGAEPAELFRDKESVTVIVRSFLEGDEGIRLDIQAREGLRQQLVVSRDGLRALANGSANVEGFLLVDCRAACGESDRYWLPRRRGRPTHRG